MKDSAALLCRYQDNEIVTKTAMTLIACLALVRQRLRLRLRLRSLLGDAWQDPKELSVNRQLTQEPLRHVHRWHPHRHPFPKH